MEHPIYLDYNGTTPHDQEVINAMRPFFETEFGNPSSRHWFGVMPKKAVENARRQVARLLNCDPQEIVFTSGGTESNNHAIKGVALAMRSRGNHIITNITEHPAVLNVCRFLERYGFETTYLPVDQFGTVYVADLEKAINSRTILISLMHANNEVGTIQPVSEVAAIAKKNNIIMHTDAAQSAGKIVADVNELGVDLLSIAGHKIYAPKGVGALFIRQPIQPEKFCHGAGQEMGRRAGTENVLEIVGLGKACEIAARDLEKNMAQMKMLRDRLYNGLISEPGATKLIGHPENRLPNTLSLAFKGLEANRILEAIGTRVAASAGAACHAGTVEISHVLEAMDIPLKWAKGAIRFSVGRMTTVEQIDKSVQIIVEGVKKLNLQKS